MKRYQVYLNPHSVSILDDFQDLSNISRSELIRQVIDRYVQVLSVIYGSSKNKQSKNLWRELEGFIDLKTDKKNNFSQSVDDIYQDI